MVQWTIDSANYDVYDLEVQGDVLAGTKLHVSAYPLLLGGHNTAITSSKKAWKFALYELPTAECQALLISIAKASFLLYDPYDALPYTVHTLSWTGFSYYDRTTARRYGVLELEVV